jgi:hypothetical protein
MARKPKVTETATSTNPRAVAGDNSGNVADATAKLAEKSAHDIATAAFDHMVQAGDLQGKAVYEMAMAARLVSRFVKFDATYATCISSPDTFRSTLDMVKGHLQTEKEQKAEKGSTLTRSQETWNRKVRARNALVTRGFKLACIFDQYKVQDEAYVDGMWSVPFAMFADKMPDGYKCLDTDVPEIVELNGDSVYFVKSGAGNAPKKPTLTYQTLETLWFPPTSRTTGGTQAQEGTSTATAATANGAAPSDLATAVDKGRLPESGISTSELAKMAKLMRMQLREWHKDASFHLTQGDEDYKEIELLMKELNAAIVKSRPASAPAEDKQAASN